MSSCKHAFDTYPESIPGTNLTPAQFVLGLEDSIRNLPETCRQWSTYDEELAKSYVRSMKFFLDRIPDVMRSLPDGSHWHTRLYLANERLQAMRPIWGLIIR